MKRLKKIIFIIIFILPFVLGVIGYYMAKESILDAMYQSAGMYFFDAGTKNNNALVEVARWTAPVMMISGIVLILKEMFMKVKDFFITFSSDAVCLYGDEEICGIIKRNINHAIFVKNGDVKDVKSHIIAFLTDEENLKFYERNKEKLKSSEVFLKLESKDCFAAVLDNVKFFNPNEIIARDYWQKNNLLELFDKNEMKIAIIGSGALAQKIISYGLLNNIYTLSQRVEYHVWGNNMLFESLHSDFEFMNSDSITYHKENAEEDIFKIAEADRIIIAEQTDMEMVSALSELTKAEIDCFDPSGSLVNALGYEKLSVFGKYEDILTSDNIRTDNLYRFAKELNYEYAVLYDESGEVKNSDKEEALMAEWEKLNIFTKGSNIASGDYHEIRLIIMKNRAEECMEEELSELEHIRWCRYHFMNHWKYGKTHNGKKDAVNRLHPCLVPFSELSDADKNKDAEAVNVLLKMKNTEDI